MRFDLNELTEGFLSERKGKVIPCRGTEDRKGSRTNRGKSGLRNLEAEAQMQSGKYGRVYKFEDSHRDTVEQCVKFITGSVILY